MSKLRRTKRPPGVIEDVRVARFDPRAERDSLGPAEESAAQAIDANGGKEERVAAMRRQMAQLQKELAGSREELARELQGRADEAERIEELEAKCLELAAEAAAAREKTDVAENELATAQRALDSERAVLERLVDELDATRRNFADLQEVVREMLAAGESLASAQARAKKVLSGRKAESARPKRRPPPVPVKASLIDLDAMLENGEAEVLPGRRRPSRSP